MKQRCFVCRKAEVQSVAACGSCCAQLEALGHRAAAAISALHGWHDEAERETFRVYPDLDLRGHELP